LERGDLKNGVFTYSILEFLERNPEGTLNALKKYVNKRVIDLTSGNQEPTSRGELIDNDWIIWK
jgi:hypothetical protein